MEIKGPAFPTVSAVIINWNGGQGLIRCLTAITHQSRPFNEIIVVDNASTDGSDQEARKLYDGLHWIRNTTNIGFSPAVNLGVKASSSEWVALINNDAVIDQTWLEHMVTAAVSAPDVGMVACMIYLDRTGKIIDKVGHRLAIDGQNFGRGHGMVDQGQFDGLSEVAWPDGCASLWKRSVMGQVGGLDEDFFAYADDADLGIRFRLAGWRCALAIRAIAEHRHSQTLGAYSARKLYFVERNRIWLAAKYFPWPLLLLNPFFWLWRALHTAAADRQGIGLWAHVPPDQRLTILRAIFKAHLDGWIGCPRQINKRIGLRYRCGKGWHDHFLALLREARVSLADISKSNVT